MQALLQKKIIQKKLSVRQSENLVRIFKTNKISKKNLVSFLTRILPCFSSFFVDFCVYFWVRCLAHFWSNFWAFLSAKRKLKSINIHWKFDENFGIWFVSVLQFNESFWWIFSAVFFLWWGAGKQCQRWISSQKP